ncbi:MAG TPA: carbon-nitrogen hydrolase family protein [Kofleriaceae bacterium]|nr:carbon-nitrogen hydrolase family protein [Kofleriaceae bacterium]
MADTLTVGAVQLTSTDDRTANLATCRRLAARAAEGGARVIVLPECFAFLGRREGDKLAVAEVLDEAKPGPILTCLAELATRHRALVIGGGLPEAAPGEVTRAYNTALAVAPGGAIVARYRKIHLFDVDIPGGAVARESDATVPGAGAVLLQVEGFGLGLSICYDLRFPELYRQLWRAGADALLVPAAFTAHTGRAHWHVLLRARAIENQAYVIAAAQVGRHNEKRETFGHSMVIDPWGRIVGEQEAGDGVVVATLDRALLAETRRNMPCAAHAVTLATPAPVTPVRVALPA